MQSVKPKTTVKFRKELAVEVNLLVNKSRGEKRAHYRIWVDRIFVIFCLGGEDYEYLGRLGITVEDLLGTLNPKLPAIDYNNYGLSGYHEHNFTPYPDLIYQYDWPHFRNGPRLLSVLSDIGREETSVQEIKERVSNWIRESVAPLYLESLFTS